MISLSNVIRPSQDNPVERMIEIKKPVIHTYKKANLPPELEQEMQKLMEQEYRELDERKQQLEDEHTVFEQSIAEQKEALHVEAQRQCEKAKIQGHEEGFEAGQEEALNRYQGKLDTIHHVLEIAERDYHHYLEQAEEQILALALKISEKIIKTTLEHNDEAWINLVKHAIQQVREQDPIKIMIHSRWYELVTSRRDELEKITHHQRVLIIPDDGLTENQCLVETSSGRIEADVDSQLKMMQNKLFELLEAE